MSATLSNFLQLSSIPCASASAQEAAGQCMTNVDGVCIRGGTKVAGTSGYELASMGYPQATCAAAGLFVANNQRYTVSGWGVSTNANTLKLARPWL
jgi:hypothetical protein